MHLYGTSKKQECCAYGCCGDFGVSKAHRNNLHGKPNQQAIATRRAHKRKARQVNKKLCSVPEN